MHTLSDKQIRRIFAHAGLGEITTIRKIEVGFSNDIYAIDERYMLKIGRAVEDDESLREIIAFPSGQEAREELLHAIAPATPGNPHGMTTERTHENHTL